MIVSNRAPVNMLDADVVGLPHPERPRKPNASRTLPRPVSLLPNIADSGRICFGAGFRLRG